MHLPKKGYRLKGAASYCIYDKAKIFEHIQGYLLSFPKQSNNFDFASTICKASSRLRCNTLNTQ